MEKVHYAQCWEDPKTLISALQITPEDDVISIASAGDNTLALLLENPRSLIAVDHNPAQIFLTELKISAIQVFDYDDFVKFIGARPLLNREHLYKHLKSKLSSGAKQYWNQHHEEIEYGIIRCGKFEHYLSIFRRMILPLIHKQDTVQQFLGLSSLSEQQEFYELIWNNRRWQWLFCIFFSKFLLKYTGRGSATFKYVVQGNIAKELLGRTRHGLTNVPIKDNYFVKYILTGKYCELDTAHPYLQEANFTLLKEQVGRIGLFIGSLDAYLQTLSPNSILKFNLSDIFEYMPDEAFARTLNEILRVCREGSKIAFWTLFIDRHVPYALTDFVRSCSKISHRLYQTNRTFFYDSFECWEVGRKELLKDYIKERAVIYFIKTTYVSREK